MATAHPTYDWSQLKAKLKAKGKTVSGWCDEQHPPIEYSSLNNLRYGFWTPRHGYGPEARRIIDLALKDGLIEELKDAA